MLFPQFASSWKNNMIKYANLMMLDTVANKSDQAFTITSTIQAGGIFSAKNGIRLILKG